VQDSPYFTLEDKLHRLLINVNAAFDPPKATPNNIMQMRALHINRELSDADCQLLTSALPAIPNLTNLLLDASATHPADTEVYDPACIDGGGVTETLAAALSSMHWLRRLSLCWPMHGVVPIAAALPALESLQDFSLCGPPPGLSAFGISIVARGLSTVTGLQRYAIVNRRLVYHYCNQCLISRVVC
jgi:hypothetical protein